MRLPVYDSVYVYLRGCSTVLASTDNASSADQASLSPPQVCLMSRDEQNVLVVSYAELKNCLEQVGTESVPPPVSSSELRGSARLGQQQAQTQPPSPGDRHHKVCWLTSLFLAGLTHAWIWRRGRIRRRRGGGGKGRRRRTSISRGGYQRSETCPRRGLCDHTILREGRGPQGLKPAVTMSLGDTWCHWVSLGVTGPS